MKKQNENGGTHLIRIGNSYFKKLEILAKLRGWDYGTLAEDLIDREWKETTPEAPAAVATNHD